MVFETVTVMFYFRSQLMTGLLSAKSDTIRREKIAKDIKKVDAKHLELRASKPSRNSHREVLPASARRSLRRAKSTKRSRSATKLDQMEVDEDVFALSLR